ncbi:hypothetical protein LXL04_010074 [Taraxacum kok-saghyz]
MEAFDHLRFPLKIILHATKNFGAENFIAEGGFGKVYRGEFSNTMGALFNRLIDKADVSFRTEIMFLTSCSHENLISLMGFCDEGENRILVYEYADFGLSRHGPANQDRTFVFSEAKGTLGYCDPMYVEDMLLTKESDVYSFGVVLFEALCSRPCVEWKYTKYWSRSTTMKKDHYPTCRPKMESVVSKLKTALEFQEIFDVKIAEIGHRMSLNEIVFDFKPYKKTDVDHFRIPLEKIMDATKNFSAENFIAESRYGKVYRGEFSNTMGAVKLFNSSGYRVDTSFRKQIELLTSSGGGSLPESLLGFCDEGDKKILVYEYACNRSLDFQLMGPTLKWIQRLKICVGVACGLHYLHDPKVPDFGLQGINHCYIESGKILLDANWNAKIADFGLPGHDTMDVSKGEGTLGYCDPTGYKRLILTEESDVYSFGVILFEVLCSRPCVDWNYTDERRSLPILVKKRNQEQMLHSIIDVNLWQQMDQECFDTFVKLALQCLEKERKKRPTMVSVIRRLKFALILQEIFELNEEERRSSFSPNQVLLDTKSQETESSSSLEFRSVVGRNSVILYTTTIQFIKKTFTDCSSIRSIIKSYNVVYEERDLSMHSGFKEELQKMLGRNVVPPKLFIKGRYIGGAKEVLSLHEQDKLLKLLAGIPENSSKGPCKECDGLGFVTCGDCEGSRRLRRGGYGECTKCNEKGLVFCNSCKYATEIV